MGASHAADLELARGCAAGDPAAWDRFVRDYRPVLYRAADALDHHGGAREVADSLYAELYGFEKAGGERRSLFLYFEGRSSLATWLRAVLAQRYVDRLRSLRRLEPLADDGGGDGQPPGPGLTAAPIDADPAGRRRAALVASLLARVVGALIPKDRLRLASYYVQQLTLAETGRLLRESEATVSRQLARTRRAIRAEVERLLRAEAGWHPDQIAECLAAMTADPGPLDLARVFRAAEPADQARERSL